MKNLAFLILLLVNCVLHGQETSFSSKFSNTVSSNITKKYITVYNYTDIGLGIRKSIHNGSFNGLFLYRFGGSLIANGQKPYKLMSHFIGGEINYRFFNDKKVSPMLGLNLVTEIASNYQDQYIRNYGPHGNPKPNWNVYHGDGFMTINYYDTYYYVSTPLIGSFIVGCDFQLTSRLNFNIALGYGFKVMNIKYKKWKEGQNEPKGDLSKTHALQNGNLLHCIDLNVGFNYTFPLKKK